jgi:predicted DNA-binding protein YlxM (UPF0122 family)
VGLETNGHKLTAIQKDDAVALYSEGQSIGDIANEYGVSRQAMWDVLRRRTKMRPNLRYGKDNHFYRGETKDSDWAQNKVEKALKRGDLLRPALCEKCGSSPIFKDGRTGIHAHHPDYNKPLEVVWLCQRCHHEWHKMNKAVPRNENGPQTP